MSGDWFALFGGVLNRVARIAEVCHGVEANKEDAALFASAQRKGKGI